MATVAVTASAGIQVGDAATLLSAISATDSVRMGNPSGDQIGWAYAVLLGAVAQDAVQISANAQTLGTYAAVVKEVAALRSQLLAGSGYSMTIMEKCAILDEARMVLRTVLASSISLTEALISQMGTKWTDTVALATALAVSASYQIRAVDATKLLDFAGHGLFALVREQMGLQANVIPLYKAIVALHDEAEFIDDGSPVFRAIVVHNEAVVVGDVTNVAQMFNVQLQDGLEFVFEIADPSGGGTTWSINMRSSAVTSYTNYNFNSYAEVGGRYYGASVEGLYELSGSDDAGEPIVATIGNGIMELTGSFRTGLQAAYVAVRGEGEFFLKLEGPDRSVVYRVAPRALRTTRVNLGKGWRARYLTWELQSVGQDFDLMSLEFLPFPMRRTG